MIYIKKMKMTEYGYEVSEGQQGFALLCEVHAYFKFRIRKVQFCMSGHVLPPINLRLLFSEPILIS